jgi:hypothetical protein
VCDGLATYLAYVTRHRVSLPTAISAIATTASISHDAWARAIRDIEASAVTDASDPVPEPSLTLPNPFALIATLATLQQATEVRWRRLRSIDACSPETTSTLAAADDIETAISAIEQYIRRGVPLP